MWARLNAEVHYHTHTQVSPGHDTRSLGAPPESGAQILAGGPSSFVPFGPIFPVQIFMLEIC